MLTLDYERYCSAENFLNITESKSLGLGKTGRLTLLGIEEGRCAIKADQLGAVPLKHGNIVIWNGFLQLIPSGSCAFRSALLFGEAAKEFANQIEQPIIIESVSHPASGAIIGLLHKGEHMEKPLLSELSYSILCRLTSQDASVASRPALVTAAIGEMHSHFSEVYGIDELADSLNTSKSHLIRVFSKAMGISPGRYLTEVRIQAAKKLLQKPEYSLETISALCGFSGANYFCRVFKKETGETPVTWRNNNQESASEHYFDEDWEAGFYL